MLTFILLYLFLGVLALLFFVPLGGIDATATSWELYYTKSYITYLKHQWGRVLENFGFEDFKALLLVIVGWPLVIIFICGRHEFDPRIFYKKKRVLRYAGLDKRTLIYFKDKDEIHYYAGSRQVYPWIFMVRYAQNSSEYKGSQMIEGRTRASHRKTYLLQLTLLKYANSPDCNIMLALLADS